MSPGWASHYMWCVVRFTKRRLFQKIFAVKLLSSFNPILHYIFSSFGRSRMIGVAVELSLAIQKLQLQLAKHRWMERAKHKNLYATKNHIKKSNKLYSTIIYKNEYRNIDRVCILPNVNGGMLRCYMPIKECGLENVSNTIIASVHAIRFDD
jgi:hypothetical protein